MTSNSRLGCRRVSGVVTDIIRLLNLVHFVHLSYQKEKKFIDVHNISLKEFSHDFQIHTIVSEYRYECVIQLSIHDIHRFGKKTSKFSSSE